MYGDKFADEIHPDLRFVGAGILAMANSGPNTNGTLVVRLRSPKPTKSLVPLRRRLRKEKPCIQGF